MIRENRAASEDLCPGFWDRVPPSKRRATGVAFWTRSNRHDRVVLTTRLRAGRRTSSLGGISHAEEEVSMYARIARFEGGDVTQIDDVINAARQMIDSTFDSPPEGLEGSKAVWMLVDRENARGLGITLFETEEDLRRGDQALNAMSPAVDAGQSRSSVEVYEVAHRRERE